MVKHKARRQRQGYHNLVGSPTKPAEGGRTAFLLSLAFSRFFPGLLRAGRGNRRQPFLDAPESGLVGTRDRVALFLGCLKILVAGPPALALPKSARTVKQPAATLV